MKPTLPWHFTPWGRLILWLGSVQLAVPVLVVVAVALAGGTYLESTRGAGTAKELVYGSWWFFGLMVLVCMSLIFAVVTRFPWKARHAGFMLVHASLIALITAGFWSLYGRVEGRIGLEAGHSANQMETSEELLELVEMHEGEIKVLGSILAPTEPGEYALGDQHVRVTNRWKNVREEFDVLDNGPHPYRAVEVAFDPDAPKGTWVGEETQGGPADLDGLMVRVFPAGAEYENLPSSSRAGDYVFVLNGRLTPLGGEGAEVAPGWTITSIKRYERAAFSETGIVESAAGRPNPAIEVAVSNGHGSSEMHVALRANPDMAMSKHIAGSELSGAKLVATGGGSGKPTLVIFGTPPSMDAAYVNAEGVVMRAPRAAACPATYNCDGRKVTILQQFTRAKEISHFSEAPDSGEARPALVVSLGADREPFAIAWKSLGPIAMSGHMVALRFGPRVVPLPFSLRLDKFTKLDYPGTDMAMAYESDVTVFRPNQGEEVAKIHMNSPLKSKDWKVYQSGFMGRDISIFSVMKDPGLPLTYASSVALCVGILVTFYSRRLSWGHPGIPSPFASKELSHAPRAAGVGVAALAVGPGPGERTG